MTEDFTAGKRAAAELLAAVEDVRHETETLDKLYLELSQFTRAQTARDIANKQQIDAYGLALMMIREGCANPVGVASVALAKFTAA